MNEPSDPQRPKGGDRPRETAAFEDTEFSFGKAASTPPTSRQGYLADVVESDHPDVPDDGTVIDAEIVDETGPAGDHGRSTASRPPVLGSTTDPEMTGIIPAVRDDSERPGTGPGTAGSAAAGSTAAEETAVGAVPPVAASPSGQTSPEGVPAGGSGGDGSDGGDDGGDDGGSFSFRSVPPWAWILVIGVVLAVLVGLFAASLMRHNSVSDSSPLTSVVPSYGRPTAWNSTTPTTTKIPDNSAGLGYDGYGYGYGYGDQSGDDSWNDGSDWTDTTEEPDTSGPTGTPSTGAPGTGQETPGGTGTPGTGGGTTPGTPGTDPGTGTSPGTDPGTGGTPGTGGNPGTGGTPGTGGNPGTGETPGTGGGTTPGTGDGDSTTTE